MKKEDKISKSSILLNESRFEENDLKSFSLFNRSLREKREEIFESDWIERIKEFIEIEKRNNGSYSFYTDEFDIVDFYPKVNKILIRKSNRWINSGLEWIIANIIENN